MSNEKVKNKLVNSMKMTKAGTAKSTTSEDKNEAVEAVAKESKPAKKDTISGKKAAGRRIWPD